MDRENKHRVTPQLVVRANRGERVGVLMEWVENKDMDLRER